MLVLAMYLEDNVSKRAQSKQRITLKDTFSLAITCYTCKILVWAINDQLVATELMLVVVRDPSL